ncbi:MAG: 50S ribosomal protein L9 [Acidobacteriota bacterium]
MEIILIDDVFELGKRGEVVKVADGYGRNFLIPKKLAIASTPGNLKMIEQQRLVMAKKEAKYEEEATLLAQELNKLHLIVSRKSGDGGALFGSVTTKDIGSLLEVSGIQMDRRKIILDQPIKEIGNYKVQLRPHSAVSAEILLSVLIEGDESIARVKNKDEESEAIIADMEAKLLEAEAQDTESPELSDPDVGTQEELTAPEPGTEDPAQESEPVAAAPEEQAAVSGEQETAEASTGEEEKSE